VNALCLMADSERLALLKEVAGTTLYDDKRRTSLEQMNTNRSEMDKITEVISYINTRLSELEGEKEELAAFQKADRSRRALEYTLYDKELVKAREQLDSIEYERQNAAEELEKLHEAARATHDKIRGVEAGMARDTSALRRAKANAHALEGECGTAVGERTRLEMEVRELRARVAEDEDAAAGARADLKGVEKEIEQTKAELGKVEPRYRTAKEELESATAVRDQCVRETEALYAKQGRGRRFRTAEERDAALEVQITDLVSSVRRKETEVAAKEDALAGSRRTVAEETKTLATDERQISTRASNLTKLTDMASEKKSRRNMLAEERRSRWSELEMLADRVSDSREVLRRATADLRKSMSRAAGVGLDSLSKIVQDEGIPGYYGPVVDNLSLVDPKYRTAVEVCAGDSLFHVIVDSDATAATLMTRLERQKLGRVTFLPLNRLEPPRVQYPDSTDVVSVLERCIRYDQNVAPAMQHIFARKLLAKDDDSAALWSNLCNMDAVTIQGDEVNRKGALTGGYHDSNKSRFKAHEAVGTATKVLEGLEAQQRDMKTKADAIDQTISSIQGEILDAERKQARLKTVMEQEAKDVARKKANIERNTEIEKELDSFLPALRADIISWKSQIESLQAEKGTELSTSLNQGERAHLKILLQEQKQHEQDFERASSSLAEISIEKERLEAFLKNNLLRRRTELQESINPTAAAATRGVVDGEGSEDRRRRRVHLELELQNAEATADKLSHKLEDAKKIESERYTALNKAKVAIEKLNAADMENRARLEAATDATESLLNKRSMWASKREEYMGKIQELGSIPRSDLPAHAKKSVKVLMRGLDDVNKKLKKYSHVNKKAYDQYINFSEQRESLLVRKQELDRGAEKVQELIDSLDRQKDEAINRTFNGVSMHFRDVWKELVPGCDGRLIMRTAVEEKGSDNDDTEEDESKDGPDIPDVNMYRGVQVEVKFSSKGENYLMSQLSGGQKALVAMALIFAIQRCDPAPFYLFDELDQALDSSYRASVANLIQKQATHDVNNPTQFVCSTFRPEIVQVANRCFGISHQNKVSNIHVLGKTDALGFVSNLMNEEEAVQKVSSIAKARLHAEDDSTEGASIIDSRKSKRTRRASLRRE